MNRIITRRFVPFTWRRAPAGSVSTSKLSTRYYARCAAPESNEIVSSRQSSAPLYTNTRTIVTSAVQSQYTKPDLKQIPNTDWDPNFSPVPFVDDKLSYVYGRSRKELRYQTVASMMDQMVEKEPHSTAVVAYDEGISKNFEELRADVHRLVNGLVMNLGLKRGDEVAVYSYNCYQSLLVHLACNMLGLNLTPMNPSYKAHEFSYVLAKSEAKVLFTTGKNSRQSSLNNHHAVVCDKSVAQEQTDGSLQKLTHIVLIDGELKESELPMQGVKVCHWRQAFVDGGQLDGQVREIVDQVSSDDPYGIYYTSGTTGFPKGACVTQFTAVNNCSLAMDRLFMQRGSDFKPMRPNVCMPLPLFHAFAGVLGILLPFCNGGSFVLTGARYNIGAVVDAIMRFKCNAIFLTPTILIDLLTHVERNKITDLPLKSILIAGSKVLSELVHKTHKILPDLEELRIGYGSSENGVIATLQTSQETPETRPLTVGMPLDFCEIRVADVKTDDTTPIGQSGEVQTRGFNTMIHYFKDPNRTDDVLTKARWYKTGDIGIVDKAGSLQIVGRIKELIIKGGENVYPAEIETVLHAFNLIEDGHVFGVPDKRYGEEVAVWIKLDKTKCGDRSEDELRTEILNYCKQKLTYFKVPKYVIFVEEFPLTGAKKIKKYKMRAETIKMLNL